MNKSEIANLTLVETAWCDTTSDSETTEEAEFGWAALEERVDWDPESPPGTAACQHEAMDEMARRAARGIADVRRTVVRRSALLDHSNQIAAEADDLQKSDIFAIPTADGTSHPVIPVPGGAVQSPSPGDAREAILYFEDALHAIKLHDFGQARLHLEKALSLDPDNRLYQANYRRAVARQSEEGVRCGWDFDATGTD